MGRAARDADRGSGLIGTLAGVLAFLVLLLFAAQVLYNLYATSVLTAASFDAARIVAAAGGDPAARVPADARLRAVLGGYYERAEFDWRVDGQVVELHVDADNRNAFLGGLPLPAIQEVHRTVRVRVECFRVDGDGAGTDPEACR